MLLRKALVKAVENIDSGNSHITDEDAADLMTYIQKCTHAEQYFTKYQAYNYLHISRSKFDSLVSEGKIPQGTKLYPGDNNLFWKVTDIIAYRDKEREIKKHYQAN